MPDKIDGAVITIRRAKILLARGWRIGEKEASWDGTPYHEICGQGDTAMVSRWDLEDCGFLPRRSE